MIPFLLFDSWQRPVFYHINLLVLLLYPLLHSLLTLLFPPCLIFPFFLFHPFLLLQLNLLLLFLHLLFLLIPLSLVVLF